MNVEEMPFWSCYFSAYQNLYFICKKFIFLALNIFPLPSLLTPGRFAIATGKPYSYILQFAISLGQLYGTAVYFITSYLEGDNFAASSYFYYAYYIGANASWVVIPTLIAIRCWKKICAASQVQGQKKAKVRWGQLPALFKICVVIGFRFASCVISFDNNFSIDALFMVIRKYWLKDFATIGLVEYPAVTLSIFQVRTYLIDCSKVDASGLVCFWCSQWCPWAVILNFLGNTRFIVFKVQN